MLRLCSFILVLALTSCSSVNSYIEPNPQQYGSQLATIKGLHKRYSLFDWREAYITSVDDKEISYMRQEMIGGFKGNKTINVTPGRHSLVVNASFNKQFAGNGPYETYLDFNFTFEPRKAYHLDMDTHGATISVWVEDQAGKKVSSVVTNNFKNVPRTQTVFIPINTYHK